MPLFEFELANIDGIVPWGTPPNQNLHWFGLTDGCYHMDVHGNKLFQYSEEILAHWKAKNHDLKNCFFVDYQVARFWEDVLEILPTILNPIPDELHRLIATPEVQAAYEARMESSIDDTAEEEEIELFILATDWIRCRYFRSLHLVEGPSIFIFRHRDEITIRWDNEGKCIDGIKVWSNQKGEERFSIASFVMEVRSFHERLMEAMDSRLAAMLNDNPIPSVNVDMIALADDHRERKSWLAKELHGHETPINKEVILGAITRLRGDQRGEA